MTSDKPVNTEDLVLPDDYNLHIFYLYIKIREQDEKWEHVGTARVLHPHWKVTTNYYCINPHHKGSYKLKHLKIFKIMLDFSLIFPTLNLYGSEILFPPQIFSNSSSDCRESIVRVHQDMNTAVEHCSWITHGWEWIDNGYEFYLENLILLPHILLQSTRERTLLHDDKCEENWAAVCPFCAKLWTNCLQINLAINFENRNMNLFNAVNCFFISTYHTIRPVYWCSTTREPGQSWQRLGPSCSPLADTSSCTGSDERSGRSPAQCRGWGRRRWGCTTPPRAGGWMVCTGTSAEVQTYTLEMVSVIICFCQIIIELTGKIGKGDGNCW